MKVDNGNIISDDGKVLCYSIENFVKDICEKDSCFICGVDKDKANFNDEHVIPRWILKRYELFGQTISLPNEKKFKYGQYKISCCVDCNSLLGINLEKKISEGFKGDLDNSIIFFNENRKLIFVWICLLYLKTHLRDRGFKYDFQKNTKISDIYEWEHLHHIHCIARSIYTKVDIDEKVIGSMFLFPCINNDNKNLYDYIDLYGTGTVLIRLGNFIIICVINDSKLVSELQKKQLSKINRPINAIQLRELYARITYQNLRIIDKPKFGTVGNYAQSYICIKAFIEKKVLIAPHDDLVYGSLLYKTVKNDLYQAKNPLLVEKMDKKIEYIKQGKWTFLFDEDGNFAYRPEIVIDDEDEFISSNSMELF